MSILGPKKYLEDSQLKPDRFPFFKNAEKTAEVGKVGRRILYYILHLGRGSLGGKFHASKDTAAI